MNIDKATLKAVIVAMSPLGILITVLRRMLNVIILTRNINRAGMMAFRCVRGNMNPFNGDCKDKLVDGI